GAPLFGAGEERYLEDVRDLGERLGLDGRLELTGFRDDVGAELAGLDVLVHASTLPEPFGQVVAEGMAAGLPVVAAPAGGRVVLAMARAFPGAPIYTSLFEPAGTFPEFRDLDVRPLALNAVGPLRRRHRAALPLLAPSFSRLRVQADAVLCSSSGWAHGAV